MRAWILIASYQLKDISRRWFETPGGVCARLAVAVLLVAIMFLVTATFQLAAKSIESRILRLGVNTLFVRVPVSPDEIANGQPPPALLLAPLSRSGHVLALKSLYATALGEYGESIAPLAYDDSALPALAPLLAGPGLGDGRYLLTSALPEGITVRVLVDNVELTALTRPLPAALAAFAPVDSLLLLPEASVEEIVRRGHQSLLLFSAADVTALPGLTEAVREVLNTSSYRNYSLQSAAGWIEELALLHTTEVRWQRAVAAVCTLVLVLVFGSLAVLEYRQTAYIGALLRSFGTPGWVLVLRYFVEAALLLATAAALARLLVVAVHEPLFQLAGFESAWLNLDRLHPYHLAANPAVPVALAAAALLSVLPVAWSLRRPVGRTLG
ncbi:MAG: hypothetical protein RIQ79_2040 [Verrucomicrobiota bacterium]